MWFTLSVLWFNKHSQYANTELSNSCWNPNRGSLAVLLIANYSGCHQTASSMIHISLLPSNA